MPLHDFPLILVTRAIDGGPHVGEILLFNEVLAVGEDTSRLNTALAAVARQIVSKTAPLDVHRRTIAAIPVATRINLQLKPPKPSVAWREPIELHFDVLRWRHGDEASIAYIPALAIEVVAARDEELDALIERHIRAALARENLTDRLFDLAQTARIQSISLERQIITVEILTPSQIAADNARGTADAKPVIDEVGSVLTDANVPPAYEVDPLLDRLADTLMGRRPKSALLVGASGVGKTALVGELFRRRSEFHLATSPFWMTSGARLIAGTSGYGLWQERCQKLCRQAKQAGAILHLGNLVELMEVGKAGGSGAGIASFFRPYLARGDVLAIAECTPEQLPLIERSDPHLLAAFETILVEEPSTQSSEAILRRAAQAMTTPSASRRDESPSTSAPSVTDEAIDRLHRLHRRYATYSASPGRPLRFLRNLIDDHRAMHRDSIGGGSKAMITAADVTAAFSRETGLPLFLLDDAVPLDLAAAREHFASRVIGQDQAVDLVTDLLATVKTVMNRPRRPIASLLFLGPTGVGKTEMAKALAEYFFGDAKGTRLVRFDLSEYATASAVTRLVGTAWDTEGALTSRIREQPFCVLLLDEFEKAHPAFFDLLLQVLDDARLTDAAGRLADFSNAIVVMTSNLGSESFGAGPFGLSRATVDREAHAQAHFTQSVRDHLRPELFNRIDRIVPFLPLDPQTIERIAIREIELISRRDGIRQRDVRLSVSPAAIRHLSQLGYDPVYGARPLKRRIERDLLAPLADAANQYAQVTALDATIDAAESGLSISVSTRTAAQSAPAGASAAVFQASSVATLRRRLQGVARSPAASALSNELFTLNRLLARQAARPQRRIVEPFQRERHKRLQAIAGGMAELGRDIAALEDALLLNLYEDAPLSSTAAQRTRDIMQMNHGVKELQLHLFTLDQADPHAITVAVYGNASKPLFTLARSYVNLAIQNAAPSADPDFPYFSELVAPQFNRPAVSYYTRIGKTAVQRTPLDPAQGDAFLSEPRGGILGIVLEIRAPFARARLETESGIHLFEDDRGKNPQPILVDISPQPAAAYRPPKDVEFRVALTGQRRRTYTFNRAEADDAVTAKTYRWNRDITTALTAAIEDRLWERINANG